MTQFIKNNRLIIVLFALVGWFFGLISLFSITKEAFPSVDVPFYNILTAYPGADPKTIDEQVTDKIIRQIKGINGIKNINSYSYYNVSSVLVEFDSRKKDLDAGSDIRAALDQVASSLPSDANTPVSMKIDMMMMPIYQFNVSWPFSSEILYERVKKLEEEIKAIPWVSEVAVSGKPEQEIKVNFDLDKLLAADMDVAYPISQLRSLFMKIPTDKKEIDGSLYSFEIATYDPTITSVIDQTKQMDILNLSGRALKLGDLATVSHTYKPSTKKVFLVTGDTTLNSIWFFVTKNAGTDLHSLTLNLQEKVEEFRVQNPDLETIEIQSSKDIIQQTYNLFLENFWETGVLVLLVIVIFLGGKSSLVVSLAFLLVYLLNFFFLDKWGFSFNMIVSFSLILVLGIMIDNLIVISQWISIWLREEKGSIRRAIKFSLHHYSSAVFFGTMCTIVIFVPLLFNLSGIIGEFMKSFPIVIISNLSLSLIVALIVLPAIYSYFFKDKNERKQPIQEHWEKITWELPKEYELPKALLMLERRGNRFSDLFYKRNETKKKAQWTLGIFWIVFIASVALIPLGIVKTDFLKSGDQSDIRVNIKYKPWISEQQNRENTQMILDDILQFTKTNHTKDFHHITVEIWSANGERTMWGDTSHYSSITLKLYEKPKKWVLDILWINRLFGQEKTYKRKTHSSIILQDLREYIDTKIIPKYSFIEEISPLQLATWPSSGKPVGFYLMGENLEEIGKYHEQIIGQIKQIPGIYNVSSNIEYTNGRIQYALDTNKLKEYNISPMSVATLFAWVQNSSYTPNGITIKEFNDIAEDPIDMRAYISYKGALSDLKIGNIPLTNLVKTTSIQPELVSIDRFGSDKAVNIQADKQADVALSDITASIDKIIKDTPPPAWVNYKAAWDVEFQDTSGKDLGISIIIGIFLMYIVLVILFKNFAYPTAIITSIFLSVWWAIIMIAITGMTFDFPAQLWLFWILWVWVNQAIIHVEDFKIFYEQQWMSVVESFRKSIALRFIPIFLTKLTTVLGLLILAFKDEIYWGMAVAFIGWLLMSFFITLLYLPTLIRVFSKEKKYSD